MNELEGLILNLGGILYFRSRSRLIPFVGSLFLGALTVSAQGTFTSWPPNIGSSNVADADPSVIRPATRPRKVQLSSEYQVASFQHQTFSYVTPADCPGP